MKKQDAREVERVEFPSELSVVYEGASEDVPVHPSDLSIHGMFIHTPKYFPEGTVLKIQFRLRKIDFLVKVRGEVRHCIPGTGVGVQFLDLTEEAGWAIEQELSGPTM